jgi:hypothetical protein
MRRLCRVPGCFLFVVAKFFPELLAWRVYDRRSFQPHPKVSKSVNQCHLDHRPGPSV